MATTNGKLFGEPLFFQINLGSVEHQGVEIKSKCKLYRWIGMGSTSTLIALGGIKTNSFYLLIGF